MKCNYCGHTKVSVGVVKHEIEWVRENGRREVENAPLFIINCKRCSQGVSALSLDSARQILDKHLNASYHEV